MIITAKFGSQCPNCGSRIETGDRVNWERGQKATHAQCAADVAVAIAENLAGRVQSVRTWSDKQGNIFDTVLSDDPHNILVAAGPGAGKTTTAVECASRVRTAKSNASVIMCAFNASIAGELKQRVPAGVEAATFHSVWFRALSQQLGKRVNPDKNKVRKLANEEIKRNRLDRYTGDLYLAGALRLVSAAKAAGVGICIPDEVESWIELMDRFEIEFDGPSNADGIKLAQRLLVLNNEHTESIDFDDMLYLSALFGVQCQRYDFVFVDEAQDFTPLQLHLLHRMISEHGKLIAIGDRFQSIYAFRGASCDSMDRIKSEFDCIELPLDVSYRCPRLVVEEAQRITGFIQPAPNAPDGVVERHSTWKLAEFLPTDAVLCRNTAPLVGLAYRCLSQRIPVRMTGREIGDGLVSLIRKMDAVDIEDLQERLSSYAAVEVVRLNKRMQEEKADALQDKIDSINTAISNLTGERTIEALIAEIEDLFTPKAEGMLTLSTVHRAKGQEWPRTFILNRDLMPSRFARTSEQLQQEQNIMYVAYTRAMEELHFITTDGLS
jgi:superfamily I DNA/RNA helicase